MTNRRFVFNNTNRRFVFNNTVDFVFNNTVDCSVLRDYTQISTVPIFRFMRQVNDRSSATTRSLIMISWSNQHRVCGLRLHVIYNLLNPVIYEVFGRLWREI